MSKPRILIAEDERIVAEDIKRTIERFGYAISSITSSSEETVKKAQEERPDLVLMDIVLAGESDGIEAAQQIRDRLSIPVVFLTAFADDGLLMRAKITEPYSYILKPFQDRELYAAIEMALSKHAIEMKLIKSEEFSSSLLNNSPISIIAINSDTSIRFVNPAFENLTGFSSKEIVGVKVPYPWWAEETMEKTRADLEKAIAEGFQKIEELFQKKNGERFWVELTSIPVKESGGLNFYLANWVDITERKQAIEQIERHNRELAILNKITTSVSSTLDLHEILDLALSNVLEIAGLNTGSIYLMDHQAEEVALVTYRGSSEEFAQQVRSFKMGESLTGRVAQSGEPIVVGDLTKDSRVATSLVSEEGIHSFAAIPMKSKGKVQGVICIASHRHHQFIHEEIQLYISIADHIGIAIENARLYEKTKQVEQGLRESEGQKKAILDSSIDRIRLADKDMRIIWANQTHTKDLNMAPEDLEGKVCYEVFVGRDSPCPECPAQKALKTGKVEHTTLVRSQAGGIDKKTYLDSYAVPIKNESGEIVSMIMITRDITEQVLDEKRLRESKERYRELADSITDVFFAMDKNLRYTYWNKASEELTGIPAKNAIGKSLFKIFPDTPQTRAVGKKYREVLKTQKTKTFMNEYHLKGKRFFFDITVYPSRDGLSFFARDITKQKKMELAFWESEERYRSLFNGVPVGLYRTTPNGKILDANTALMEIMGYPNRETILQADTIESYVNLKDREFFQAIVEKQGAIYGFETQLYGYDGTPVWVEINARVVKNADGNILYYEGSMTDITGRKQAQEALIESGNRFRELFNNMSSGVAVYEPINDGSDFIVKDYNKAGELISKVNKEHIVGRSALEVFPGIKQFGLFEVLQRVWKTGESEHHPVSLYQDDYLTHWAENYVYKLPSGEIVAVFDDVTERVQAEEELRCSQEQLRSLADHLQTVRENERTSIAREIHDELGQALTGLKMDLSWMAKKIPEDQKSLLDKVHSMSELTGTTLRTVQRISTELRPGLLDDLGLVAAAEWQIEEFQNRTGIRSKLTVDPEDITLDDRRSTALFRILQETLTNVARHTQATRVHVSLKEKGKHLKLRVRDNGKGITKEQISDPKSFGLIGIRERAKSCGGEVKISCRPGKGTTVVVRIPGKN
jgi:PAS domain S-box-containing protein